MKKEKILPALMVVLIFTGILNSCKKADTSTTNKCAGTICYNTGIAADTGAATCYCRCQPGYFGDSCQITIAGSWQVYKYLLYDIDHTTQFAQQYTNYRLLFTAGGAFTETWLPNGSTPSDTNTGTYHFINNQAIALDDSSMAPIERQYTLFDLRSNYVQFRNDTAQLYLSKLP